MARASSDYTQIALKSSNRTKGPNAFLSNESDEGYCCCFFCDAMPRQEMKATYTANKPGVKCANCKIYMVARSCSNLSRKCKSCQLFCECPVCCDTQYF